MKNQTSEPTFGGVKYSASLGTLISADGNPIDLRKQCIDVFRCLAANPGSLVNKEDIVENVWGTVAVTDDSVVQCISEIRRAIGDKERQILRTLPRRGYMLVPDAPAFTEASDTFVPQPKRSTDVRVWPFFGLFVDRFSTTSS